MDQRTPEQKAEQREWYLKVLADDEARKAKRREAAAKKAKGK